MLDDLKQIHFRDKKDALGVAENQWRQLRHDFKISEIDGSFENIVFAGMGGSALAARISLTWPGHKVPFEIVSDYDIPSYVSKKTLFIASSYSGNTEETISALNQAIKKQATVVVISSGGKLEDLAMSNNLVHVTLPRVSQPRFACFYSLKALVTILEVAGFVSLESSGQLFNEVAEHLKKASGGWVPTVPISKNKAKQIALDLMGTSPVIYAGKLMYPAAYKWKISINENAKNVSWCNQYPEFNHNEFMGWLSHPVDKPYSIIDLHSDFDHIRVQKRFSLSQKLLSGKRPHPITINAVGGSVLEQLLWTITLGDFVSIYLALLNNVDPTQVDLLEKFKKQLG